MSDCTCSKRKVWWMGDHDVGLFFGSSWEQIGDGSFLFQHDCAPVQKNKVHKAVDEHDRLDLNPKTASHPVYTLLTPVEKLPRRVETVIAAKGGLIY